MICGVVNAQHEALVRLKMRGPGGIESDVDFIVDSGFTASLTLPRGVVTLSACHDIRGVARCLRMESFVNSTFLPPKWSGTEHGGGCLCR